MSEDKPWYQDGGSVFVLLILTIFLGPPVYRWVIEGRPPIVAGTTVRAYESPGFLFAPATFNVEVWHRHPGGLQNSTLKVHCSSDSLKSADKHGKEVHTLNEWQPGEDNSFMVTFPVTKVGNNDIYHIYIQIDSADTLETPSYFYWQNGQWLDKKDIPK